MSEPMQNLDGEPIDVHACGMATGEPFVLVEAGNWDEPGLSTGVAIPMSTATATRLVARLAAAIEEVITWGPEKATESLRQISQSLGRLPIHDSAAGAYLSGVVAVDAVCFFCKSEADAVLHSDLIGEVEVCQACGEREIARMRQPAG